MKTSHGGNDAAVQRAAVAQGPRGARTLTLIAITREAAELDAFAGHEQIWLGRDIDRGLTAIVAIHNTALGPALGGTRIWPHETFAAALTDALRLSRGMTLKAALAGVPFGGGKAVIMADAKTEKTAELLEAYADVLVSLEGQFFTGEDVGLSLGDADFLRRRATNVTGTTAGGSGNPSPVTAHGVFLGLQAALRHQRGTHELDGIRVAVQGLGSVGLALAAELHRRGARLTVADIDAARLEQARARFDAACVGPEEILAADVDIFAPCALGSVLSGDTIPALKASIVAGSANNQLARHEDAGRLRERAFSMHRIMSSTPAALSMWRPSLRPAAMMPRRPWRRWPRFRQRWRGSSSVPMPSASPPMTSPRRSPWSASTPAGTEPQASHACRDGTPICGR